MCLYTEPQLGFGSILTSSSKLVDGLRHSPAVCALHVTLSYDFRQIMNERLVWTVDESESFQASVK